MHSISQIFHGRLGRANFALGLLGIIAVMAAASLVSTVASSVSDSLGGLFGVLMFVVGIVMIVFSFSLHIRRFHDLDWSGWFILLELIPLVNLVFLCILLFKRGTEGANRFGAPLASSVGFMDAMLNKVSAPSEGPRNDGGQPSV